jgi:hypothetical protein
MGHENSSPSQNTPALDLAKRELNPAHTLTLVRITRVHYSLPLLPLAEVVEPNLDTLNSILNGQNFGA